MLGQHRLQNHSTNEFPCAVINSLEVAYVSTTRRLEPLPISLHETEHSAQAKAVSESRVEMYRPIADQKWLA